MARTKQQIKEYYDEAYAKINYNNKFPTQHNGMLTHWAFLNKHRKLNKETDRALEIGCGAGNVMYCVSDYVKECYGVDISETAINMATKFLMVDNNKMNCFLRRDDSINFYPDGYFDIIHEFTVFQHMLKAHVFEYLEQCSRKIKKGGYVLFHVNYDSSFSEKDVPGTECQSSWSKEEFTKALNEHKFVLVDILSLDKSKEYGRPFEINFFVARRMID